MFKRMRRENSTVIELTQNLDDLKRKSDYTDPKLPHHRIRRYLSDFGFRGAALNAEVKRIVAGPEKHLSPEGHIWYTYPYGWDDRQFTRSMRRIFKGRGRRNILMMDEAHLFWNMK
ncbi:hypothetical protein C9426_24115 [Serratia sp. S1B]|nr:hypothetical protein C9426_24115 [Serratia sp. S1B]